jgi:hypothetical protein
VARMRNAYKILGKRPEGIYHFRYLDIGGRIILKYNIKKQGMRV